MPRLANNQSMHNTLLLSGLLINLDLVETVDNLNGEGAVQVHFMSGNNRSFVGEDAVTLRKLCAPEPARVPEPERQA